MTTQSIKEKIRLKIIPLAFVVGGLALASTASFLFWNQVTNRGLPNRLTCADQSDFPPLDKINNTAVVSRLDQIDATFDLLYRSWVDSGRQNKKIAEKIQVILRDRQTALLAAAVSNPNEAANALLSEIQRADALALTSDCIEEPLSANGILQLEHSDDFVGRKSFNRYVLVRPDHSGIAVHFTTAAAAPTIKLNTEYQVQGWQIGTDEALVTAAASAATNTAPVQVNATSSGVTLAGQQVEVPQPIELPDTVGIGGSSSPPEHLIILLVNFNNTTLSTKTRSHYQGLARQVANNLSENSYNKVIMQGVDEPNEAADVRDWVTLSDVANTSACNPWNWSSIISSHFTIPAGQYTRTVVIGPFSCGWGGAATIGGDIALLVENAGASVMIHELGHGFGGDHGNFLDCGTVPLKISGCAATEYQDYFTPLGYGGGHFNARHKDIFNWFDSTTLQTITTSGRYTIAPIETISQVVKALRVQRAPYDYLYIEYRQANTDGHLNQDGAIVFSPYLGAVDVYNGAVLHTMADARTTNLLDAGVPSTPASRLTVALLPGTSMIDPLTGTTISTVSATATALTVDITVGNVNFNPLANFNDPTPGQTVSGTFNPSITATDDNGIQQITLATYVFSDPFGRQRVGTLPTIISPTPAGSSTFVGTWDTSRTLSGGEILMAVVYDTTSKTTSLNQSVTVQSSDTVPPTATVTSPLPGASMNPAAVHLSASATDDQAVYGMQFYLDGSATAIDLVPCYFSAPPYICSKDLILTAGTHTVVAKSADYARHLTVSPPITFTVIADTIPPSATWTGPGNGSLLGISATTLSATASDGQSSIQKVEFLRDGGTLIGTDFSSPYTYAWVKTGVPNGPHTLFARAYDNAGNYADTAVVSVILDTILPTVTIINPPANSLVSGTVNINVNATDANGIEKVEMYVIKLLKCTDTIVPYSCQWVVPAGSGTTFTIQVFAYDTSGNSTFAQLTVSN